VRRGNGNGSGHIGFSNLYTPLCIVLCPHTGLVSLMSATLLSLPLCVLYVQCIRYDILSTISITVISPFFNLTPEFNTVADEA